MRNEKNQSTLATSLFLRLREARLVYQSSHTHEELVALADIFAEALDGEDEDAIREAFARHAKESKRFPTPAHILELLPYCRACKANYKALPADTAAALSSDYEPGYWKRKCLVDRDWRNSGNMFHAAESAKDCVRRTVFNLATRTWEPAS